MFVIKVLVGNAVCQEMRLVHSGKITCIVMVVFSVNGNLKKHFFTHIKNKRFKCDVHV